MRWTQAQLDNGLGTLESLRDALSNSESERDHRTVTRKRFSRAAEWARIFKFLCDSIIAYLQRESRLKGSDDRIMKRYFFSGCSVRLLSVTSDRPKERRTKMSTVAL